jgi:hypothetical protein
MENQSHERSSTKNWKDSTECHWDILVVLVGRTNKFVDSAKARPMDVLSFKLDYSLPTAFVH